jgi:hypothetical protein
VSGNAWEVARIIRPHVGRVVVVSPADTGIRSARAKTDRLDARALAKLLASGSLDAVWVPDEATRPMRRRLQRRSQLVRVRTKAKSEVHAALMRRLIPKPSISDLFGIKGRRWLEQVELPAYERETVDGCLRQVDFCEAEIAEIERVIAAEALRSPEVRRLMTVPGVNVITAATFIAAVGDIRRFPNRKKLVGYLGLDPKVRQSGQTQAPMGGSPNRDRRRGAMRWSRRAGARSGHRARSEPSISGSAPGADTRWRLSPRREARLPVLVPANPLGGLRRRPAVADEEEAPATGGALAPRPLRAPRRQWQDDCLMAEGVASARLRRSDASVSCASRARGTSAPRGLARARLAVHWRRPSVKPEPPTGERFRGLELRLGTQRPGQLRGYQDACQFSRIPSAATSGSRTPTRRGLRADAASLVAGRGHAYRSLPRV